jgi:hypothetical protein
MTNSVGGRYFSVMQIPVLSGRMFEPSDAPSSTRVAIVNETMARTYWPKRSAIGGRIHLGKQTLEVVGIAKNIKYRDLSETPQSFLYLPFAQQYSSFMTLHV